jgi:hypothetical protein
MRHDGLCRKEEEKDNSGGRLLTNQVQFGLEYFCGDDASVGSAGKVYLIQIRVGCSQVIFFSILRKHRAEHRLI